MVGQKIDAWELRSWCYFDICCGTCILNRHHRKDEYASQLEFEYPIKEMSSPLLWDWDLVSTDISFRKLGFRHL